MHRLNSYKGSPSFFGISIMKPVRSVYKISWNMLQNLRVFSSCKCSFGAIVNAPSQKGENVIINGNFNQEIPYASWVNLVDPKYMPNLKLLEICQTSNTMSWDPIALKSALLERYPAQQDYAQMGVLSRVRLSFRIQVSPFVVSVLTDLGPDVLLLVQSLVIANTGSTWIPLLSDGAVSVIQQMVNLEHISIESSVRSIPTSINRMYSGVTSGLRIGERGRSEKKGSPAKLMGMLTRFKHLKQLELPAWSDLQQSLDFEILQNLGLTDLTCDLDHLYQLSSRLSTESQVFTQYLVFEHLQSLEIFIPKYHGTPVLNPVAYSRLDFVNLKRLLCFTDDDNSALISNLVRKNAHHLEILHGNRLSIDDLLYLLKAEQTKLKMLCVEEFNEFKTTDIAIVLDNDGRTAPKQFLKDLKRLYSRFKHQKSLQRLVLPVMKYSSNFIFVEHYITRRCLYLKDLWFISAQQVNRKKVLMTFNSKKDIEDGDLTPYQNPSSGKLQNSLEQYLSERYIKQVFMVLPSKTSKHYKQKKSEMGHPHIRIGGADGEKGTVYEMPRIRHLNRTWAPQALYRCDLGKWRKDLEDDYMSRTLRSILNTHLKN